jgi:beta-lactamase superfamily II metal-dependent hydrolase
MDKIFDNELFKLFRGTRSSNRNKSGLVLTAHRNEVDIIMPGDHHYDQIDNYIRPECVGEVAYLVVPHHGGHAGPVDHMNNLPHLVHASISVGDNPWSHPLRQNRQYFERRTNLVLHRTDTRPPNPNDFIRDIP